MREPDDPAVAVYWQVIGSPMRVMAIDRYDTVAGNLAAIAATLDAMRAIERHGGAQILERAFAGFDALPAPPPLAPFFHPGEHHVRRGWDLERRRRRHQAVVRPEEPG